MVKISGFYDEASPDLKAQCDMLVGLHLVELDAELVGQQSAEVGEHAEDADRTCDGSGLGNDVGGRSADVVTTGGCIAAHRNDDGLLGLELCHSVVDLLRSVCRTAGGVDAQHDGFHVVILGQLVQVLDGGLAHDVVV